MFAGALEALIKDGELSRKELDGLAWIYPSANSIAEEVPRTVKFLAPFDPLVWDRRRFELLWGWQYRFEAYTPVAKRGAWLLCDATSLGRKHQSAGPM